MNNKFFLILALAASSSLLFNSCNKDDSESNISTNGKTTAVFNSSITYGTMTDQDGNVYKTVTIGAQTWMAENLRTTKYNDGTAIPNVKNGETWATLTTAAYCNYNNTSNVDTIATYGRLYNWYAVNTSLLAPKGWHVPTDNEWQILIDYLGGEDEAGGKLKETGSIHWESPNAGATNETGFTAIPGGGRGDSFVYIGGYNYCWTATEYSTDKAWTRVLSFHLSRVNGDNEFKWAGVSVRCIKD